VNGKTQGLEAPSCLPYSCLPRIPKIPSIDTCTTIAYPTHSRQTLCFSIMQHQAHLMLTLI